MYTPNKEGTMTYLNGNDDLKPLLDRVEKSSGKIVIPKTEITPKIKYFAVFKDTEGNHLALHSKG